MDLQEEYFARKRPPARIIRYVDKGSLILRAKEGAKPEWEWLHVSIETKSEPNHPAHYQFLVAANPVIYASADFSHFSYHNTHVVKDEKWEWDQYEKNLVDWAKTLSDKYVAIQSSEAIFVSWGMFMSNYDSWVANFLPYRVIDWLATSLRNGNQETRLNAISEVETWIRDKYDRVFSCWRNIRQNLDQKNYADWLADVINNAGKVNV
jgi:hypothetical protein